MTAIIKKTWYPASVRLPDGSVLDRVKIFATDAGLLVYSAPDVLDWSADIDYTTAPEPRGNPRNGVTVHTDAGDVVITASGGCGCGNPLKKFRPAGAVYTAAWTERAA